MLRTEIVRVDVTSGEADKMLDCVAEEKPLHIFLGRVHYATILCSPSNLKELGVGHLLSERIVKSVEELEKVALVGKSACRITLKPDIDVEKRLKLSKSLSRVIFPACGSREPYTFSGRLPKVKAHLTVKAKTILECVQRLNTEAKTFRKTGGVHAAAVYDCEGRLKAFAEDVGRHNAADKVIGIAALKRTDFSRCFLALSGRLSSDVVFKAASVGLPVVASLGAPTDAGMKIASDSGLTLVGFVRGRRMNIYTFPKRISICSSS